MINAGLHEGPIKFLRLRIWKASARVRADASSASLLRVHGETETAEKLIIRMKRAPPPVQFGGRQRR